MFTLYEIAPLRALRATEFGYSAAEYPAPVVPAPISRLRSGVHFGAPGVSILSRCLNGSVRFFAAAVESSAEFRGR